MMDSVPGQEGQGEAWQVGQVGKVTGIFKQVSQGNQK